MRAKAAKSLHAQGVDMQRLSARSIGRLPIVGDMVQFKIPDVDRGKFDAPCLTTVVVEVISFRFTLLLFNNYNHWSCVVYFTSQVTYLLINYCFLY